MRAGPSTDVSTAEVAIAGATLEQLASQASCAGVRESDVLPGDWIIIRTKNSTYTLRANGDRTFDASGGWFSRREGAGERLRVAGCSWGGSALLIGMLAAPGMCVEFSNRVTTTRIRAIHHIRSQPSATTH